VFVANDFATRISSSSVIVISDATNQVVANITVGHSPEELAYDAVRGEVFVTNSASGTVSVIADDTNTVIATIAVGQGPFGAAYDDGIGYVYVSNEAEGTVSIISPGTPAPPPPTYPVSFTETGLPAGTSWSATLDGATLTSTTNTVTLAKANGTYAYSVGSVSGYTVSPSQGSVTVNGAGVSTSITFTAVPPPTYDVTFTDTGLPAGTTWAVTLAGTTHTSTGNAIAFSMTDGTYAYTIGSVPGYSTTPGSGSIAVHGSAVAKTVAWTPVMYTVTFEESGLSPSTSWSVTVQGTTQSSTSTQIVFSEPNGTVYYYIVSVAGYTTSPTSGTMTVNGHDVMRSVTFTQTAGPPTIGSFSASASAFVLGSSVTLTITASGGTGVLTYAYGGLPAGCSSANVSALTCTPTATGVFRITATVTDAAGRRATATVDVTVNPPFMSTVDCGQGLTCSIRSNAALSNVRFTGNTIRFTATGPLETQAYANMTVPKAAIQNIHSVHVRVNHNSIDDSAMIVTSDGTNYYLYITFALHSAVEIDIELAPTADVRLTIFGLDPPILFGTTAFILAIAPLGALVALRRKKRSVR
jgi:YVTN family beta-propeller protein